MNIIEAFKSGKFVRRKCDPRYPANRFEDPDIINITREDVLADDWETIEEEPISITESDFNKAYMLAISGPYTCEGFSDLLWKALRERNYDPK